MIQNTIKLKGLNMSNNNISFHVSAKQGSTQEKWKKRGEVPSNGASSLEHGDIQRKNEKENR